jgi:sodium-independent sulfate anion transporter 11
MHGNPLLPESKISCLYEHLLIPNYLQRLKEFNWCEGPDKESTRTKVIKKTKWLLSISANCLVVVLTSLVAWLMVDVAGIDVLNLTGEVDQGLPAWQLPWEFNRNATTNGTSEPEGPVELATELGIGLLMLPMVSILQHLAIAKHYAGNRKMAASQEMIALGFCQFVGSFTGSMAVTASFGRSAVNATSGVRTPFGGVFTGIIIILACAFLSPYLAFIPTSALSAVIIFAMFYTIDYNIGRALWKAKKIDLIPYTLTFLLGLFVNVETGLIVGCLVHVGLLLYSSSSPALLVEHHGTHTLLQPQYSLFFPSVDHIRGEINTAVSTSGSTLPVVIDMTLVKDIDYTAAKGLCALVKDLKKTMTINIVCTDKAVSHVLTSVYGSDLELSPSIDDAVKLTVV